MRAQRYAQLLVKAYLKNGVVARIGPSIVMEKPPIFTATRLRTDGIRASARKGWRWFAVLWRSPSEGTDGSPWFQRVGRRGLSARRHDRKAGCQVLSTWQRQMAARELGRSLQHVGGAFENIAATYGELGASRLAPGLRSGDDQRSRARGPRRSSCAGGWPSSAPPASSGSTASRT